MVDARQVPPDSVEDADPIEYRTVEPWAVVAAALGVISSVAFIAPMLWLVPMVAIGTACIALARLRESPQHSGRAVALVGLGLALFCLAAPVARSYTTKWLLGRQARDVSDPFIAYLVAGSPEKAMVLHVNPDARPPIDDGLWPHLRHDLQAQEMLRILIAKPEVRMLLALGDKAQVEYLGSQGAVTSPSVAMVNEEYAVTFVDSEGKKKTLLMGVLVERRPVLDSAINPWRVRDISAKLGRDKAAL